MSNMSTRFTGIFIPAEILEMENLTLFEMILLSWIDALYCPNHGGCYASNEYLGKKIRGAQENTVAKALTKLRGLGLIEDVSFDGRTRVIRALINRYLDQVQSKAALDKNPRGVGQKSNPEMDKNPSGVPPVLIYDSKEERKDKSIAQTASRLRKSEETIKFCFDKKKFINITEEDIQEWKEIYTAVDVVRELRRIRDWALSELAKSKAKKRWRKCITNWLSKEHDKISDKQAYRTHQKNQVIERNSGFQKDERPRDPSKTIKVRYGNPLPKETG